MMFEVQLKNGEVKRFKKPMANILVTTGMGNWVTERETKEEKAVSKRVKKTK